MGEHSMPEEFMPLEVIAAESFVDDETRSRIEGLLDRARKALEETYQRFLVWKARKDDVSLDQAFRMFESDCLLEELGIDDGFMPPVPNVPLEAFEVRAARLIGDVQSIAERLSECWQRRFCQLAEELTQSVACSFHAEARTRRRVIEIYRALDD